MQSKSNAFLRHNRFYVYGLLAHRLILKRLDHPLSAVFDCLSSIFAAVLRIRPYPESAPCCRLTDRWPTLNGWTSIILWGCMTAKADGPRLFNAEACCCYQGCPRGILFYLCPDFSTSIDGFGGLVVSMLASGTQGRGFIFMNVKNPQHAFLRRGSKRICPMSQLFGMRKNLIVHVNYWTTS
jgi:hypothetical protein